MTLFVTGGHGFVMSHLVRRWLEEHPQERAIVLDSAPADDPVRRFLEPVATRLTTLVGDVASPGAWVQAVNAADVRHVVHGAAMTPHPYLDGEGAFRDPEREDPRRVLRVNIEGTCEMLEVSRRLPNLKRFIYISSGSIYSDDGPDDVGAPLPEDGYVQPGTLYGISKFASEMIVERYATLFDMPCASARLSAVYGPMDRVTASRHVCCLPNLVAHLAVANETLRVSGLDAVGDWIHADDVAAALSAMLAAQTLRHAVYNIAYGRAETVETVISHVAQQLPVSLEHVEKSEANVICDPERRAGQWGAYDISRLRDEFGWRPMPLAERLRDYVGWLSETTR